MKKKKKTVLPAKKHTVFTKSVYLCRFRPETAAHDAAAPAAPPYCSSLRNFSMILLSMREICTCETPMRRATSLCVRSRK